MTISEGVAALLRKRNGVPICDDCIKDRLNLAQRQVQQVTSSLAALGGTFQRRRSACDVCGVIRQVTSVR